MAQIPGARTKVGFGGSSEKYVMVLAGEDGRVLAERLVSRRPDLKVLFMTGYAENAAFANGFLEHGMEMITKPFAMERLASKLREMVERR